MNCPLFNAENYFAPHLILTKSKNYCKLFKIYKITPSKFNNYPHTSKKYGDFFISATLFNRQIQKNEEAGACSQRNILTKNNCNNRTSKLYLRQDEIKGSEVKVILLINEGDIVNNLRAKMSGIDDCEVKAEGYKDLIRIIKNYIPL